LYLEAVYIFIGVALTLFGTSFVTHLSSGTLNTSLQVHRNEDTNVSYEIHFVAFDLNSVKSRIVKWRQDQLHAIDSHRIFMFETTGYCELDARKSYAAESAAKHNPDRSVQIFFRLPFNQPLTEEQRFYRQDCTTMFRILQQYSNVELILYNELEYFNNTLLENLYVNSHWRESTNPSTF
jgi:hypothetical protein